MRTVTRTTLGTAAVLAVVLAAGSALAGSDFSIYLNFGGGPAYHGRPIASAYAYSYPCARIVRTPTRSVRLPVWRNTSIRRGQDLQRFSHDHDRGRFSRTTPRGRGRR